MLKVKSISLGDVFAGDRVKFNTNNIGPRPDDYEEVLNSTRTSKWVDQFHSFGKDYISMTLPIEPWMLEALKIGEMTGRLPRQYSDEIDEYVTRNQETPLGNETIKSLLERKTWFIRDEKFSLKFGIHGAGPYTTLKQIVESLVTTRVGHSPLKFEKSNLTLYGLKWRELTPFMEYRVFVYKNKVTAISQQNLYSLNTVLRDNPELIQVHFQKIIEFFNEIVSKRILYTTDYCMDFTFLKDGSCYFIEINPFGGAYSSGSALFEWIADDKILRGDGSSVEFRYTIE